MFHSKDGWFFERLPNGDVHVIKKIDSKDETPIDREVTFTPEFWASIVASVSAKGEFDGRWRQALDFHAGLK